MKVTIGLASFAFINLILFIVLANPFVNILTLLGDEAQLMDDTNVPAFNYDGHVAPVYRNLTTLFGLLFLLSFVGLIIWYFLGSHREEGEDFPGQQPIQQDYYGRGGGGFEGLS